MLDKWAKITTFNVHYTMRGRPTSSSKLVVGYYERLYNRELLNRPTVWETIYHVIKIKAIIIIIICQ